jgi:two-component system, OmpR family, response regulator ChvI
LLSILLVDDEPDITFALSIGLEDNGFVVNAFNDPLLALQAFKDKKEKESFALALIDIKMPKMNGFELYNEIRKIDDKVKVCFVTAFDIEQDVECLIRKPIVIGELVKRVRAKILYYL